nr:ribonuclease H-like domain-containing protein [Tanacetum cinerariifolium]GEZ89451.1 ribonuclease H-like domain-containing protein [Tanacetum cinerariifolium]
MWLFRYKYLADGTLSRYKARRVANGSTQLEGVDVDETFSPVVKPGTIRTVLSLAASRHWPIHQLDIKNAFYMVIYLRQFICISLQCFGTLYILTMYVYYIGLSMGSSMPLELGFSVLRLISRVLVFSIVGALLHQIITSLHKEFAITDLGSLNYFLGSLQYLTFTRLDISYAVQQVCLYMHDPREPYFLALKRILR